VSHSSSMQTAPDRTAGPRRRLVTCAALSATLVLSLVGCGGGKPGERAAAPSPSSAASVTAGGRDLYDLLEMDFKTPAAMLTNERHTGAFATGDSLNMGAVLKPLAPGTVREIRLDTTHKIIEIAPGVKFSAWTFGDTVPGPVVRARVGDRIKFTMSNRSDEPVPGVRMTAAPMMHSMDFHSAMVSPQDKYRSIAPGQTISFEFTLNYAGVFMYHCGTPMVLEHIASGMYGMMIVEPRNGYPTKVDREYAVTQSEFYTKLDPQKRKVDGQLLHVLDGDRVRAKAPTYTVFNGRHNGMVDKPLQAKPGERVRLFVMNVGPSNTSSFHVVGTIFDRVWIDGNPDNQFRGMQTVLLGSSNGAIVEFMIPEAGSYVMGRPPLRQRFAGRHRPHCRGRQARGRRSRAPQHARSGCSNRSTGSEGQAGIRVQVPGLPLGRWRRQAWPRRPGHQPAPRCGLAHALAEVTRADVAKRCDGEDAAGQVEDPDAQPRLERRGDQAVPRVLQVGGSEPAAA